MLQLVYLKCLATLPAVWRPVAQPCCVTRHQMSNVKMLKDVKCQMFHINVHIKSHGWPPCRLLEAVKTMPCYTQKCQMSFVKNVKNVKCYISIYISNPMAGYLAGFWWLAQPCCVTYQMIHVTNTHMLHLK